MADTQKEIKDTNTETQDTNAEEHKVTEQSKTEHKKKTKVIVITSVCIVLIGLIAFAVIFSIPYYRYKNAIKCIPGSITKFTDHQPLYFNFNINSIRLFYLFEQRF